LVVKFNICPDVLETFKNYQGNQGQNRRPISQCEMSFKRWKTSNQPAK